jgi:hypothetical protein
LGAAVAANRTQLPGELVEVVAVDLAGEDKQVLILAQVHLDKGFQAAQEIQVQQMLVRTELVVVAVLEALVAQLLIWVEETVVQVWHTA